MRNYVIPAIILLLLIGAGIFEDVSLNRNVEKCTALVQTLIDKTDDETIKAEDVVGFSEVWNKCKNKLHTYIPHTEIRDVDVWVSEAKSYVASGEYEFARAKLVVVRDKIISIPNSFKTTPGNVF